MYTTMFSNKKILFFLLFLTTHWSVSVAGIRIVCSPAEGGTVVKLSNGDYKAIPNEGYTFSNWYVNFGVGDGTENANPCDFGDYLLIAGMYGDGNVYVTAKFKKQAITKYTITFNANGGLIPTGGNMGNTPSGHITTLSADRAFGTVVVTKDQQHFCAMVDDCPSREGYTFAGWYTDQTSGVQVYDNTGYRVVGTYWNNEGNWIGTSNVTLYAHWTPIPYTITVNSSNLSQGTTTGGGTYYYGTNHQITATPNDCYQFTKWSDGNTDNPRTIIVNGDATYTAEFLSVQYSIKVESADESQGAVSVELVSTVGKEKDRIYYTSSDGNIVTPYSATVFGANIVSNTYQDGQGVIIFDSPVVSIGGKAFYNCKSLTSVTIGNSVTSIGESAFMGCKSLTSVTIPNSVTSIGGWAFYWCHSLTSVTIPNSVTSIGKYAFYGCSSLASITIPNSVTSIGDEAFYDCSSLTAINVDSNNPNYCSVDGVLFNKDQTTLIQYPKGNTRSEYTIPNSVTSIGNAAFRGCSSLTSVTIPNSVTSIGSEVFYGCSSLTSINVDSNNPNYSSVDGVLFNEDQTTLVAYPGGKQGAYTIPNSVTSIGDYAFFNCYKLTSVTIGNSVTSIGDEAFRICFSLTSVTFEGLTPPIIGKSVFNNTNNCPIYIPYGTKDAYVAALNVNNTIDASRVIEK